MTSIKSIHAVPAGQAGQAGQAGLKADPALAVLAALAEPTRLRIVALAGEAELTVSEYVAVLGQSQPRVSRHLRLMAEAGVLSRHKEGAWAFFRLADGSPQAALARAVLDALERTDAPFLADRSRLAEVRAARAAAADAYFARHAADFDRLRARHAPEEEVEAAILAMAGPGPFRALLDLGAGTGRTLELLAPTAERAVGIDLNPAMLGVARARVERAGLRHVQLRHGDVYAAPATRGSFDLAIVHQVLHYLDDPARALREAARALAPGGRLIVVDFAPHGDETLRSEHAHRRLGFSADEVAGWLEGAGLRVAARRDIAPPADRPAALTVSLWLGVDPRRIAEPPAARPVESA